LPGGRLNVDETPYEAALRESEEEIGFVRGNLIGASYGPGFMAFVHDADPFDPVLNEEHDDWTWARLDSLPSMHLHHRLRGCLEGCLVVANSLTTATV
jgi:8-oxo-dGTP pyrophosphatase MutT (NUDIX family)